MKARGKNFVHVFMPVLVVCLFVLTCTAYAATATTQKSPQQVQPAGSASSATTQKSPQPAKTTTGTTSSSWIKYDPNAPPQGTITIPASTQGNVNASTWYTGSYQYIQWTCNGTYSNMVDVTLWQNNRQVVVISKGIAIGQTSYRVPIEMAAGNYEVRITSDHDERVEARKPIAVKLCTLAVTSPTQANTLGAGSGTSQIAWTFTGGNPGPLKLELVPAGGGSGQLIADNVPYGSGQYSWQIPGNTNPGNYQIRITSMGNSVITATSQTFSLQKFGSVGIVVADPKNFPIDGATVTVIVNGTARSATTKTNGQALFDLLPPGTYTFTATKDGYYQPGTAGTATASTTVTLASGATQSGVIKLEKFGWVKIVVLDPKNNTIDGATVSVIVNGVARSATGNINGEVTFDLLASGTYTFTATKDGYRTAGTTVTSASGVAGRGQINLEKIWGSVSIAVLDAASNLPIDRATVTVIVNGTARSATTKTNGQALFDLLPPGTYTFTVTKDGYIPLGNANTAVTLRGAEIQSGLLRLQQGFGTVKVAIKEGANPINDYYVDVRYLGSIDNTWLQDTYLRSGRTSADGTVSLTNIRTGNWVVKANTRVYNLNHPLPHYMDFTDQNVTVTPNATATVTISLQRYGVGIFTVTDGTMPIYMAQICLEPKYPAGYPNPVCSSEGYTNAMGEATIDIEPGSHTLQVVKNDYNMSQVLSLTMPSGGTVTRTVALTKK